MADFNESVFDGLKIRRAAVDNDDAVRLGELTAALSSRPLSTEVDAAIAAATHPAASAVASTSIALAVDEDQVITASIILYPDTDFQSAATGLFAEFNHPIFPLLPLNSGRLLISNVVVTRRNGSNTVMATGGLGVDYLLNATSGIVTILNGNLLTSPGQKVRVTFDCAQILDGSGLELDDNGLRARWGNAFNQIPRGNHVHANDHLAASGDSASGTTTVTVSNDQKVKVEVRLATSSGLIADANGLRVNFGSVASAVHSHAIVNGSTAGFMSPAMLAALNAVSSLHALGTADTFSVALSINGDFVLSATARLGVGLALDSNGINVDWDLVAQKDHTHPTVGGVWRITISDGGTGYTSAPAVLIDGDGTGATATSEVTAGVVTAIIITDEGSGYTAADVSFSGGGGTGAAGDAAIWTLPGFYNGAYLARLVDLESWRPTVDAHLATIDTEIADLEATKADITYVDAADATLQAAIDGKSPLGHTHPISDIIGLLAALDGLALKWGPDNPPPDATQDDSGFESALDKQHLDCLSFLLQEQQQALLIMPIMRLESPSLGGVNGWNCPLVIASDAVLLGGELGKLYTVQVRIRGKVEVKDFTGGTSTGNLNVGGTPASNANNVWKLIVSDPPATFYVNRSTGFPAAPHTTNLDYTANIPMRGGAVLTIAMDSIDGLQTMAGAAGEPGLSPIPDIPPYPDAFNGQFVQIDPVRVVGECLYDLLFNQNNIVVIGGGVPGNDDNGDGVGPDSGGINTIEIIREFTRLDLINEGEFDEEVREIRIVGETVWVGGKFRTYNNVDCFGLAKLNLRGRYDPFFQVGSGFSKPIDFIKPLSDGSVVAGGVLDSLSRASGAARPLWKINADGKRATDFTCPFVLNEDPPGTAFGNDVQLGVAVLDNGYICSVSEQVLNVFKPDGSLFFQGVGNAKFTSLTEFHNKLLLTSYAWSASNVAQTYKNTSNPKGAKLLNMGDGWELNLACIGDFQDGAGTEAVSTQMKAVKPDAVVLLGDNNYDFGDQSTIDVNIGKYFRKFIHPYVGSQPLRAGETDAVVNQCWPCPGNHDWGNILTARGKSNINPLANPGDLDYRNVTGIALDFGGSNYTYPPTVTVGPPDLTGTTATAVAIRRPTALTGGLRVHNARILRVEVNNGGTGYAVGTTLTFENYPGDTGTGATIVPTIVAGVITAVTVTSPGTGYHRTPIIRINTPGSGTGATFTIRRGSGSGYTTAPTLTVTSPTGSGATFNALIMDGAVYSFTKLTSGSGYSDERDIVVTFNNTGTGGSGAEANGFLLGSDIIGFTITDPGAGYTTKPPITVVGGGHEQYEVDTDADTGVANYVGGREASLTPYLNYFSLPGNERYYKLSLGDVDLFVLDTDKNEPDGIAVGSDQYNWFIEQVGNSTARWKGVVGHHVPKSSRPSYAANNGWMDAWHFATLGVDFFIGGHSHTMEHIQEGTFDYFISGNGGKDLLPYGTPVAGSVTASRINDKFGFTQLKIRQDSMTVNFIDQDGAVRYSYTKTKTALPGVGAFGDIDQIWALGQNAGTGAMSACFESVLSPREDYFVIGNSLTNYNSPNTSWNAEQIGNLLLWSEQFAQTVWHAVGAAPVVVSNTANNPSNSELTADTIQDIDAVAGAYIYQDVALPADSARYEFSVYFKRDGDSSRFPLIRLEFTGGTGVTNDSYSYFRTDANFLFPYPAGTTGVSGLGVIVETVGSDWMRVRLQVSNNGHTNLRCYIYPAYSDTFGSPSEAITGSIVAWGADLKQENWQLGYTKTEGSPYIPSNAGTNANRFRGLYKIGVNGKEDPTFAVNITLNTGDSTNVKHVIPYGIDSQDRIYFGGPVTSINGTTVAPWLLYRITKDGAFDKVFRLFNDRVLVARVTDCDTLIVGGKFTAYGSRKCGRIVWLNPDGTVIEGYEDDRLPIYSPTPPDTSEHPCYKKRVWYDTSVDPYEMNLWNEFQDRWQTQCEICAVQISDKLPPPIFTPPTGTAPLSVIIEEPGYRNATIYYTLDGSDPTPLSSVYRNPISIVAETIVKAFAVQTGFENSDIAIAYYWDPGYQQCEPVTFDAPSGSSVPCNVVMSCATPGATIYYEWGAPPSEPTTGSAVYSTPINIGVPGSLRAFAVKAGYSDSIKTQANYLVAGKVMDLQWRMTLGTNVKSGAAAIGLGGDLWNWVQPGQNVYNDAFKWTDGSATPIDLVIQAEAAWTFAGGGGTDNLWKDGVFNSTITPKPWSMVFSSMPFGTYDFYVYSGRVRLSRSVDAGLTFLEVATLDASATLVDPGVWVDGEHYVVFRNLIVKDYYLMKVEILINSASGPVRNGVIHGIQIVKQAPATPPTISPVVFTPPSGSAPGSIKLETSGLVLNEPSLKIFYTLDGTDPTMTSLHVVNAGHVSVGSGQTIKAFAAADGWTSSAIASATYGASGQFPDFKCIALEGVSFANTGLNAFTALVGVLYPYNFGHTMQMIVGNAPSGATFVATNVSAVPYGTYQTPQVAIVDPTHRIVSVQSYGGANYHVYTTIRGRAPGYTDRYITVVTLGSPLVP